MKIFLRLFLCTRLDRESTVMLPSQKITISYNLKIFITLRLLLVVFPIATHYGTVKLSQSHIIFDVGVFYFSLSLPCRVQTVWVLLDLPDTSRGDGRHKTTA